MAAVVVSAVRSSVDGARDNENISGIGRVVERRIGSAELDLNCLARYWVGGFAQVEYYTG